MYVLAAKVTLDLLDTNSLKAKRQVSKSLIMKARHKFNASITEISEQDSLKVLVIGFSITSSQLFHGKKVLEEIIRFFELSEHASFRTVERYD